MKVMRNALLISVLVYSSFLAACSPVESTAENYIASKGSADSAQANTGNSQPTEPTSPAGNANNGDPAPMPTPTPTPATTATGDPVKGQALIQSTCSVCHLAGGAGRAALNKSYIPRLDAAYTGAHKANHQSYKNAFTNPGRLDLEAALQLIN